MVKNNNDTYMIYSVHAHLTCCLKKKRFLIFWGNRGSKMNN